MVTKRAKWVRAGSLLLVSALVGTVGLILARDPLILPGSHQVEVYGLDDQVTEEVTEPPGLTDRLLGMCDADSFYAEDGGRRLCLVLNGPLGKVRASRHDGRVTVDVDAIAALRKMAGQDGGSQAVTTLVLMTGKPAALVPVADLAAGRQVSVRALS
jgi:hypothetical protein